MQGISKSDRDLWDTGDVIGHLVSPGSVFAFLAEHRRELFPDSFAADLFASRTGRPSLPADLIAEVIAATGIVRGRRKRCVDSTVFDDAVATQDTVTQLVAAVRKVARVVPGATSASMNGPAR
jgi:hypothetical protein